ncbi:MAG: hypothetical protein ACLP9K_05200 [Nitrososphaerales archaeon]
MRRRTVAILTVLLATVIVVFVFAPVVYSPIKEVENCQTCASSISGRVLVAYESPSCAVFGVGTSVSYWTGTIFGAWSYRIGCPPKSV